MSLLLWFACLAGLAGANLLPIDHGNLSCDDTFCHVTCDYGYIPSGPYGVSLAENDIVACERPVAMVVGGFNRPPFGDENFMASTEVYSIVASQECQGQLPDIPVERKGMFGGWVGGLAVVCGGEDIHGVVYSECYYFSTLEMSWLYLQQLEVERSYAAVETLDGCLLVSGGRTMDGAVDSIEVVKGEGCEWSGQVEKLETVKYGHCMVEVGGELVVVGGSPASYGSTQVYNVEEKVWRNASSPQKDRASHGCVKVVVDEVEGVLVAGNDFSPQDLAEIYFPSNDTWVWTKYMNNERTGGGMLVLGGRPTILGGYGGDYCCKEYYTTAESYDSNSGNWWLLHARNMTEGRKGLAVFPLPSSLFPGC